MDDVYENIGDYNPSGKRKSLIMFDDTIAEIISNKKELFETFMTKNSRGWKWQGWHKSKNVLFSLWCLELEHLWAYFMNTVFEDSCQRLSSLNFKVTFHDFR